MPPEKNRAWAIRNMHKKFGEVWPCGFKVTRADRQTDILIIILNSQQTELILRSAKSYYGVDACLCLHSPDGTMSRVV